MGSKLIALIVLIACVFTFIDPSNSGNVFVLGLSGLLGIASFCVLFAK